MLKNKKTVNPYHPKDKHSYHAIIRGGGVTYRYTEQGKRSYIRTFCYFPFRSVSVGYRICLKKLK
jgi:hypothetical protein